MLGRCSERNSMNLRRIVTPLVVVAAVGGGAVAGAVIGVPGLSGAQESSTTTSTSRPTSEQAKPDRARARHAGAELEAAAEALGLSVDELAAKLSDGETTIADVAEQEGVPLDEVKDAMTDAARERIDELVTKPWPKPGFREHPGKAPGHGRWFGGGPFGASIEELASALGIDIDELRQQLRDGKSPAEIAQEQGIDVDELIDELVSAVGEHLDEAVANGHLTREQADNLEAKLREVVTAMVNGEGPKAWGPMIRDGIRELLPDKPTT
jgi:uncharacterized protein YidB (DUF937 family)